MGTDRLICMISEKQLSVPRDVAERWLPAPTADGGHNSSSVSWGESPQ